MEIENVKQAAAYKYITPSQLTDQERIELFECWNRVWYERGQEAPLLFLCQKGEDIQPLDPSDADTIAEWVKDRMRGPRNIPL